MDEELNWPPALVTRFQLNLHINLSIRNIPLSIWCLADGRMPSQAIDGQPPNSRQFNISI